MTKHPVALAIALAFVTSTTLSGCDRITGLTEQEHIQRAKDFEDKGDIKSSILELKNAIQKNPDSPQARLLLGQVYLKAGKGNEAEKELAKARELGVDGELITLSMGEALLLQGEFQRVLDEVTISDSSPASNQASIYRLRGESMLGLGQLDNGCATFEKAIAIDKNHVPAYWGMANCAMARGKPDEARAHLEHALKINAKNAGTWVALGDLERYGNQPEAADAAYTKALEIEPNHQLARFMRALMQLNFGQIAKAQADSDYLARLNPGSLQTRYLKSLLLASKNDLDRASSAVQEALKINPNFPPAILLQGVLQYQQKSFQQSARSLERYLKSYPSNLDVRKLLAANYLHLEQPEKSLSLLTPYLSANKEDLKLFTLAGEAYLRSNNPKQADKNFEKALQLDPTNIALQTQVGMARLASGDLEKAESSLRTASIGQKGYKADVALVRLLITQKQFADALNVAANLEKKFPNRPELENLKGTIHYAKGDRTQARMYFEKALGMEPNYFPAVSNLAQIELDSDKPAAARKHLTKFLALSPKHLQASLALAGVAMIERNEQEFVRLLGQIAQDHPSEIKPREHLIEYYLAKKDPEKALNLAREVVDANPDDPQALALLGKAQLAAADIPNAVSTFTRIAHLEPNSPVAHYELGKALAAANNKAGVRRELLRALELKPDYVDALTALATLELRLGRFEEVMKLAQEAKRVHPDSHIGHLLEGDALLAQQHFAEAASAYERALAAEAITDIAIKRHLSMLKTQDVNKADTFMESWVTKYPKDRRARSYLAESYAARGMTSTAIEKYQGIIRASPEDAAVLNNLAVLYQKIGDPRALPTAENAYQLAPRNPFVMDTLGWLLIQHGQIKRGLELLENAVSLAPGSTELRFHYANALMKSGNTAKARTEIRTLLASKGTFPMREEAEAMLKQLGK